MVWVGFVQCNHKAAVRAALHTYPYAGSCLSQAARNLLSIFVYLSISLACSRHQSNTMSPSLYLLTCLSHLVILLSSFILQFGSGIPRRYNHFHMIFALVIFIMRSMIKYIFIGIKRYFRLRGDFPNSQCKKRRSSRTILES